MEIISRVNDEESSVQVSLCTKPLTGAPESWQHVMIPELILYYRCSVYWCFHTSVRCMLVHELKQSSVYQKKVVADS